MILRDYQQEAVDCFWRYFEQGPGGHPLFAMPTGVGKSLTLAGIITSIYQRYQNQKILMLTHVKELIEQNAHTLKRYWPHAPLGIYSSGLGSRQYRTPIVYGGVASLAGKSELLDWVDLIFIDEAHLVSPKDGTMYRTLINQLMQVNPALRVVGLTATPYRLGQGKLTDEGGLFTDIAFDVTGVEAFNRFISEGYLVPLIPKKTDFEFDVDGVGMRGGEYIPKQLQQAVDRDELTERALKEAVEIAHQTGRKCWMVFTTGVEHTIHTYLMLEAMGVNCAPVHSNTKEYKMTPGKRKEIVARHKAGDLTAVVNNNILTTGYDNPLLDMIVNLRPSGSPGLWVQMLGRGTRPLYTEGFDLTTVEGRLESISCSTKQNCLVLDFAANTSKLGPINDPVLPKKPGKKSGPAPVKVCERCNTYNHPSVRFCINCQAEFTFDLKLKQAASEEELIKSDLPVVESFSVDHVTYSLNEKIGKQDSVLVSYHCGLKRFKEWVCIGHDNNWAARKAGKWWRLRSQMPIPATAAEALEYTNTLAPPTHIRVWTNRKYPEIMDFCFDGTNFGQAEDNGARPATSSQTPRAKVPAPEAPKEQFSRLKWPQVVENEEDFEDDIPF